MKDLQAFLDNIIDIFTTKKSLPKDVMNDFIKYFYFTLDKEIKSNKSEVLKNKYIKIRKNGLQYIIDNKKSIVPIENKEFTEVFKIGETVNLPFLHWKLDLSNFEENNFNEEILVRFNSFDNTVSSCMGLNVVIDEKAGSILKIGEQGTNKDRMVDFLNTTVNVLIKRQLDNKNKFAENEAD